MDDIKEKYKKDIDISKMEPTGTISSCDLKGLKLNCLFIEKSFIQFLAVWYKLSI